MTDIMEALEDVSGATFISLDCATIPFNIRGGKCNPFVGNVQKIMTGASVMVFQNRKINGYEAMVHRRLLQEGKDPATFILQPRKWGERIPDHPIIRHEKDGVLKHYLEVIFLRPGKIHYMFEGQPIAKKDIVGLVQAEESEQGGLDNKVIIRSFALDSITHMKVAHKQYEAPFTYGG